MGWDPSYCARVWFHDPGLDGHRPGPSPQHGQIVRRAVDFEDHVICFKGAGQARPQDAVDFEVR